VVVVRAQLGGLGGSALVVVVDKVAARPVRAQAGGVERPAEVGLVLGMASDRTQLSLAVRELALPAVPANSHTYCQRFFCKRIFSGAVIRWQSM